tara:strand:- start:2806 stop:2961 length:156 start_codon:yes stop_codon:yes gene_type:complete
MSELKELQKLAESELNKNYLTLKMLGIHIPFDNLKRYFDYIKNKKDEEKNS